MKTKTQIKFTPLFSSAIQLIMIILPALLIIKENWTLIIVIPVIAITLYLLLTALFLGDDSYDESVYGVCRYRVIKEKSDIYFIQTKPLLPFFFLPWKGKAHSSFLYKKNGEEYMCNNAFKTGEDANCQMETLKNRDEFKKPFFFKKLEICSQN
jgi:hypothetical protein